MWSVSVQCLTNSKKIQKDDFLAASVMSVDDDEDEEA